jgi:L-cysteine desulfidase
VRLANLNSEAASSIYTHRKSSLHDLYKKAQKIQSELQDYALDVEERLGMRITQNSWGGELNIKHMMLHNCKQDHYVDDYSNSQHF